MPIYEYRCGSCGHRFELRQGFEAEPVARCPHCQGESRRVLHPVPIIYKGSGFYSTDHRPSHWGGEESKPKEKAESTPADKQAKEAKSEVKEK